jgi:hypothetical protein
MKTLFKNMVLSFTEEILFLTSERMMFFKSYSCPFIFLAPKDLYYLGFPSFDYHRTYLVTVIPEMCHVQ